MQRKIWKLFEHYAFLWVTLGFFLISIAGHWILAWFAYVNEQQSMGLPVEFSDYLVETTRDTLENWQSEFLQLIWQVGGLAWLLWIGSPQSKEGDERKEELLEHIYRKVDPQNADSVLKQLAKKYPKKGHV